MGFENLVPYPSLDRDSNGDGVVDGYTPGFVTMAEFLFDEDEKAQMINHFGNTGSGVNLSMLDGIDYLPVISGQSYNLSGEIKGEGPFDAFNGPRFRVRWYDSNKGYITENGLDPVQAEEWSRVSTNVVAPAGAVYARIRIDFRAQPGFPGGFAWYRNIQLQMGDKMTGYEQNDFFELDDKVDDSPGWEKTDEYKITGFRGYVVADSNGSNPGRLDDDEAAVCSFFFVVPPEADNATFSFKVDLSRINEDSMFMVFLGDSRLNFPYKTLKGTQPTQTITIPVPRGWSIIDLVYGQVGTPVGDETPVVDDVNVSWDVVEPEPTPTPPTATRSYILDFEEAIPPAFFEVKEKADGYDWEFVRTDKERKTGYYSFGPREPFFMPIGSKAGAFVEFDIPRTAINPRLSLWSLFKGDSGWSVGRVSLNGDTIFESAEGSEWIEVELSLLPGKNTLLFEYEKTDMGFNFNDAFYIDDIVVCFDLPRRPAMLIGTAPERTISTETKRVVVDESFEQAGYNKFFTVRNPSRLKSGGGPSPYPEAGWGRTTKVAHRGKYSMRSQHEKLKGTEDAAIDFTFRVPHGVKNPVVEFWNYVETRRSSIPLKGEKYPRLFNEYRIWVNDSIYKQFKFSSPLLDKSVKYTGWTGDDPSKQYACPYGKWWGEAFHLTPGKTYTITFESQLMNIPPRTPTILGKNVMAVDDIRVYWDEAPGEVVTTPVEPLIYLDNRDGYRWVDERSGAEVPPVSFAEIESYGEPGSLHQFTKIEPRVVGFLVRVTAETQEKLREKMRYLTSEIVNRPLALQILYPEGDARTLSCRFSSDMWTENRESLGYWWRKVNLSFRAFDPFWYSDEIEVDGAESSDPRWIPIENPGDYPVWPVIKVHGPISNPKITLTGNNPEDTINSESITIGVTVPADRYLLIDPSPGQKVVMFDNGTNQYSYLAPDSKLFSVPKGTNGLKLTGTGTDSRTKIVAEYRIPYWGI